MVNDKTHPLGNPLWISKQMFEILLTCKIQIPDHVLSPLPL